MIPGRLPRKVLIFKVNILRANVCKSGPTCDSEDLKTVLCTHKKNFTDMSPKTVLVPRINCTHALEYCNMLMKKNYPLLLS